jgi:cytochrome c-type biogenesis protein CcmF
MDIALGRTGILVATVAAGLGVVSLVYSIVKESELARRQGRYFLVVSALGLLLSSFAMEQALITHNFSLAYVVQNNSKETPLLFSITGMWSALEGSMLLWALILSLFVVAMVVVTRRYAEEKTTSWALVIAGTVLLFFVALMVGPANPFIHTVGAIPADGQGPNPLLQDYPLVAVHPPMLYAGFVGMTVPFAFASAALITGEDEGFWLQRTRSWTLLSWTALTIGIALGAWWSYQVLGWGGFWAWDPVENAAFLPWICATAFLHSSVAQQKRYSMRVWNYSLISAAFALTILGTYFTRSGVLQSVHAFSDSNLGNILIIFFAAVVVFAVALVAFRAEKMRAGRKVKTSLNRETALLVNNLLFSALAFVVLLGTTFPLLVQIASPEPVTVGTPYYDSFAGPLGLLLLFFMAISPVVPWRSSTFSEIGDRIKVPTVAMVSVLVLSVLSGEYRPDILATFALATFALTSAVYQIYRTTLSIGRKEGYLRGVFSKRNGGMVVHVGVALIAFALVSATSFGHKGEVRLERGQSAEFFGAKVTYLGVQNVVTPAKSSFEANVLVNGVGPFHPAITQFGTYTEAVGSPSVDVMFSKDVYLTINNAPNLASAHPVITIGVIIQPLISWLWVGAATMGLGAALAAFGYPQRRRKSGRRKEGGVHENLVGDPPLYGESPALSHQGYLG